MEFDMHQVETHVMEKDLSVVYTIDPCVVEDYINTEEHLLARDKYKVVSIDLQYVGGHPGIDQKVDVARLCVRYHVLIYHYCLATKPCDHFASFLNSPNDNVWGSTKKDSLVELTSAIIDPYYKNMKKDAKKNPASWHKAWMWRLDEAHLKFAAKNVYTCYEMHMRIVNMRECLLPIIDEGSSHQQRSGGKRHKKMIK
ncbi:uncharacterized protein [Aegilops tauschii subsp. strangulata]|uniref:uncharacterized protein n=1 Tax=Aegilops tauschii subsp. strangulata TaxID=200361 RepID=UPI003CC89331